MFPPEASLQKVKAVLVDAKSKEVDIQVSTPDRPLNAKSQRGLIGIHPIEPLQPGSTYAVTLSVLVNATEWRQTWQFTTAK